MTREDIIRMAREVEPVTALLLHRKAPQGMDHETFVWFLERFAALVAATEREAIIQAMPGGHSVDPQWVCDMIRARGNP